MRVMPSRHTPGSTGNLIVDAVGEGLRAWFAPAVAEPIPANLIAILHEIEDKQVPTRADADDELK